VSWGRGTLVLDPRENGPRGYANGGFACGALAGFVTGGTAEVTLRAPVPVGVPFGVKSRRGGGVELLQRQVRGDEVLAEAVSVEPFVAEPPYRPTPAEARAAWDAHPFRGLDLPLSDCVVCGAERLDGLRICFGPIPDRPEMMASPFTVPEALRPSSSSRFWMSCISRRAASASAVVSTPESPAARPACVNCRMAVLRRASRSSISFSCAESVDEGINVSLPEVM